MIKMWWITWYFARYYPASTTPVMQWTSGEVRRDVFVWHLLFTTHYREDVRDTIQRWYCALTGEEIFKGDLGRAREQHRDIDDTLDRCIERSYIISRATSVNRPTTSEIFLSVNHRGRDFLKPLKFAEACAREYAYFASIFASLLVGVGGTLLAIFWPKIISFLVR